MRVTLAIIAAGLSLLWPAFLNGYPLVFGDTGVYLIDGVSLHVSWARPLFYGLFMLPLHLKLSAWPVVLVQALLAAGVLYVALRSFRAGAAALSLILTTALLTLGTSLPWFVSQLMPDVFGGLMVLCIAVLLLKPERFNVLGRILLVVFAAGCIAMHQSFLPTALITGVFLLWFRHWSQTGLCRADIVRGACVPMLALFASVVVNGTLAGQYSPSPYGKIFLMTRLIYDGPGQRALKRECPQSGWSLCSETDILPSTVEEFLFGEEATLNRVGGYRVVGQQAWPIVVSAAKAEPGVIVANAAYNMARQFTSFKTGDWLLRPNLLNSSVWERVFSHEEVARFKAARQQKGLELVPDWLQSLHQFIGHLSLLLCFIGAVRKIHSRDALGALLAVIIIALLTNALVTGALSGVYDRYQSRFLWLSSLGALIFIRSMFAKTEEGNSFVPAS